MTPPTTDFNDDCSDSINGLSTCLSIGLLSLLAGSMIWQGVTTPSKTKPEVRSVEALRKCHLLTEALAAPGPRPAQLEKCLNIVDSDGSSAAADEKRK